MFKFVSAEGTFSAIWYPRHQRYTIYKDEKFFKNVFNFDHVKPYLGESYKAWRVL